MKEEILSLLEEDIFEEEQNITSVKVPIHIGRTAGMPRIPRVTNTPVIPKMDTTVVKFNPKL